MTVRRRRLLLLPLLIACAAATPPAVKPPTSKPPTSKPAAARTDDLVSLGNDVVRFHAPPAPKWTVTNVAGTTPTAEAVGFTTADRTAQFLVQFATFQVESGTGPALVKALKDERKKAGNTVVLAPTIEHDKRFDLVIHERFKVGDVVEDQYHLFKSVGPKTVMVAAASTSRDPATAKADLDEAKTSVASAKYNRQSSAKAKAAQP